MSDWDDDNDIDLDNLNPEDYEIKDDQDTIADPEAADLEALDAELKAMDVEELQSKTNETLDNLRESHTEDQQKFLADAFVDLGEIPVGEEFGITEAQAMVVEAGFIATLNRDVFSQYGIDHATWMDHVDQQDLPTFRKAALKGDFSIFHQHCVEVAKMRLDLGI